MQRRPSTATVKKVVLWVQHLAQSELDLLSTTKGSISTGVTSKTCMDSDAYLGIIDLARTEQSFQRIVSWDEEAGKVDKKFASDIEEDQEKVDADKAEKGVDLRNRSLLLEIVEHRIFGQLERFSISKLFRRDDPK